MIARRALGATGLDVPVLGFGVSGPHAAGVTSRAATTRLIRQALDGGAALLDTAPFYGDGEAERRLGAALQGVRDRALICSKAGTVRRGSQLAKDFSPAHLTASLEASLERLGTDRLDLFLLHGPAPEHLTDETLGALEALKQAGKTRLVGVCGRGPEVEAAIATERLDAIMIPVHPGAAEQSAAQAAAARAAGMGVLGIETMAGAAPGWRPPRSMADLWYLARAVRRGVRDARAARQVGAARPRSPASPASGLSWALAENRCDCAVITTTRPAHLAANLALAKALPA